MLPTPLLAVQMYVPASSFWTLGMLRMGPFGLEVLERPTAAEEDEYSPL